MAACSCFEEVMYNDKWCRTVDDKFIQHLEFWSFLEGRSLTINDHEAITDAVEFLNKLSYGHFSYYDCHTRFQHAHERFVTWNWIINFKGVTYDKKTNTATASPDTWGYIAELHPNFGPAYCGGEGEHMWIELQKIFGPATPQEKKDDKLAPIIDLDELLRDFERGTPKVKKKDKQKAVVYVGASVASEHVVPPDLMSSNKGNGVQLHIGTTKGVSLELRTDSESLRTSNASCSSAKRSIVFLD